MRLSLLRPTRVAALSGTNVVVSLSASEFQAHLEEIQVAFARQYASVLADGIKVADRNLVVDRARGQHFKTTRRGAT